MIVTITLRFFLEGALKTAHEIAGKSPVAVVGTK